DFGIAPVEAQAAGRPVVAYGRGAATETVVDGSTGILFDEQTVESLTRAMLRLESTSFDPRVCRRNAERFSADEFRTRIRRTVERRMGGDKAQGVESARIAP
ncbi:MAG: glycosyltransferase, partial [Dehalococcoidia bacterium]